MSYSNFTTQYPQTTAPISYDLESLTNTQISVTQSMNRTVSDKGGQRFSIKFNYAPLPRDKFAEIWAFLIKQKGRFGRFTIALPNQEPRGSLASNNLTDIQVNTTVEKGNQLSIKGFTASAQGVIKTGDYFRIGNSSKVYIACEDYNATSEGIVQVTTYPNLVTTATENQQIHFEPVFKVSLTSDTLTCNVPQTNNSNFSVEFIETISNSGSQAY